MRLLDWRSWNARSRRHHRRADHDGRRRREDGWSARLKAPARVASGVVLRLALLTGCGGGSETTEDQSYIRMAPPTVTMRAILADVKRELASIENELQGMSSR